MSDAGCSEAQLRSAVTAGGDYVFTCPPGTPIIYVSSPLVVTSPVSLDATGQNLRIANVTGSRLFTVNSGSLELIEVQAIGYMDGTNGTPGDDGANGASGVNGAGLACDESNEGLTAGNGSFGVPGTSGTPGGDAPGVARGGAIYIEAGASVSLFGGRLLGTVQGGNGGQGGSGGAGGSGGDGGGVTGVAAIDCPRDITGGDGGNGADAGHGAAGGDGADAQGGGVYVESGATLNATGTSFEPFSVAFGAAQGGEGGGGGEGGEGGYPGDGGVGGGGTLNGSNGASSGTGGNGGTGGDSGMAQGGAIYSEGTVNLRDAVFTDTGVLAGPGGVGGSGGDGHGADAPGAGAGGDGADGGSAGDVAGGAIYNTGVLNVYSASFERSSAGLGSGFGAGGNGGSGGDVIHPNFLNPAGDGGDGGDGGDAAFASIFGTIATIGCASFTDSSVVPGPGGGAGGGGTQGFSGGTDGASGSPGFAGAAGQLDPPGFAPPPCPGMRVNEVMLSTGGNGAAQFVELIDPADETFPAGPNEPYKVVVYDAAGTKTGEHAISTGLLAGRDNTQPLLLSTAAADSALGVTGDEVLGPTLPSVGQVCFTTGPGEIKVSCVAWGCVTSVVGVSTSLVAAPADGKSAQRQSIGGAFFQVADPTPKATNVAGTNPPRCVASSGGGSGGGGGGSGGGGSGGGGEGSGGGGSGGGGGVSSDFTIKGTASSSKDGTVTVSIDLPGPGKVGATATAKVEKALLAKSKKITVAKKTVNAAAAGVVKLKLKPRKAAKRVLRKKGKLKATVKVTYTPTGGAAKTLTRKVTFKLTRKKKKR